MRSIVATLLMQPLVTQGNEAPSDFDCVIEPSMRVSVGSQAEGVLKSVHVNRGDVVEEGQLLATLDDAVERAAEALFRARASTDVSVRWSDVKAAYGERNANRLRQLRTASAASEQELDDAITEERLSKLKHEEAQVNRRLARLEHDRAQAALGQRRIVSPVRAVVMERLMHPGERVTDQPILTLAAIDMLHVEVIAPIALFGRIHSGTPAQVMPEAPVGGTHNAHVSVVDQVMDARSGTFGVRLTLPNPDHALPAGLRCKISFDLDAPPVQVAQPINKQDSNASDVIASRSDGSSALAHSVVDKSQALGSDSPNADTLPASEPSTTPSESLAARILSSAVTDAQAAPAPAGDTIASAASSMDDDVPANERSNTEQCIGFGPLDSAHHTRALLRLVAPDDTSLGVVHRNSGATKGYLVLMSTKTRPSEAMAKLKRLGIADVQQLRRGPHAGHLSLGYYTQADTAKQRRQALAAQGLDVRVVPRQRGASQYWITMASDATDTNSPLLRRLQGLEPAATTQPIECAARQQASVN